MASTLKVTNIDTPDGTGNITVDRPLSGSGASLTSLPAGNLTGTLPAIDGSNLTGVGGGKCLQVINSIVSTAYNRTNVTATWESTGLAASITATATTSKILVLANIYATPRAGSSHTHYHNVSLGLFRDSTQIGGSRQVPFTSGYQTTECGMVWYDTTSIADTTTAITYTIKNNDADGGSARFSMNDHGESSQQIATSSIVLMEIGA
jgi:hypothetical protein